MAQATSLLNGLAAKSLNFPKGGRLLITTRIKQASFSGECIRPKTGMTKQELWMIELLTCPGKSVRKETIAESRCESRIIRLRTPYY